VTMPSLNLEGKERCSNVRLTRRAMIIAKILRQDFKSDVGIKSSGDDLVDILVINLWTSL